MSWRKFKSQFELALLLAAVIVAVSPATAFAKVFRNSYISFELPPAWTCKADAADWTCTNTYASAAKEAIIVFTAKAAGPDDTLQNYMNHLEMAKSLANPAGGFTTSKVEVVKKDTLNGQTWVDGLQLGSEIHAYYTRYLATTADNVAILVTFSAYKDYYARYSADFINAIGSLRVVAAKNILSQQPQNTVSGQNESIGAPIMPEPITGPTNMPPVPSANGRAGLAKDLFGLAIILGAIGFYLWRKKRKLP